MSMFDEEQWDELDAVERDCIDLIKCGYDATETLERARELRAHMVAMDEWSEHMHARIERIQGIFAR